MFFVQIDFLMRTMMGSFRRVKMRFHSIKRKLDTIETNLVLVKESLTYLPYEQKTRDSLSSRENRRENRQVSYFLLKRLYRECNFIYLKIDRMILIEKEGLKIKCT